MEFMEMLNCTAGTSGLVSLIVPCYNGAHFLARLLDSICRQTYTYIQLIFVNDGSVDETGEVFCSYIPRFLSVGMKYVYISQENQGQAEAINAALPYVEGEYVMWFDADDFFVKEHVEKKVRYLNSHKDVSMVCCKGAIVEETNIENVTGYLDNRCMMGKLFENILFEWARCCPGIYMVRAGALFSVLSDKRIYQSGVGQNLQLLLPVSYRYKAGYIDDSLFYYVVRKDSHSHSIHGISQWCKRLRDIRELKLYILHEMAKKQPESDEYFHLLSYLVCLQELNQRINMIVNQADEKTDRACIEDEVSKFHRYFADRVNGRQYWIWGFSPSNQTLKLYLEKYVGINIMGFVDSDRRKWNGTYVISPENIDATKMYLIILLRDHADISEWLHIRGFRINRDFFYPEFEIKESLEKYQLQHEKEWEE